MLRPALLAAGLAALAACSSPPPAEEAQPQFADLSADQLDHLRALGAPVLLPTVAGDFRLAEFEAEPGGGYTLDYRRLDGACFEVSGAPEGFTGPDLPLVSTEVRLSGVPGAPAVRVYQAADDPLATSAQVWGLGTVVSEFIEVDGMTVLFLSDTAGGCRPVTLDEGAALVAGLRLLAPGPAEAPPPVPDLGEFARADDLLDNYNAGASPEIAAEAIARRYDADQTEVEVLSRTENQAVVLLTAYELIDDSVRDERLQLVYVEDGYGTWTLVEAGRQVRCQTGRGQTDWGRELCR